jgi:hypothetical protein
MFVQLRSQPRQKTRDVVMESGEVRVAWVCAGLVGENVLACFGKRFEPPSTVGLHAARTRFATPLLHRGLAPR